MFELIDLEAPDGHRWQLSVLAPPTPHSHLLWLPALGVAAKHYLPFAQALRECGVAVLVHEWRGNGSSSLRPSRSVDWGYREVLELDLPVTLAAVQRRMSSVGNTTALIGGHSLGGQLAACVLGMHPQQAQGLWLVASGAPYWRAFPSPTRWWLPLAYRFLPWLGQRMGYLPGRRIGFGGNESRSLIRDWARTALSGRYAADGVAADLEAGMARLDIDARAVALAGDWLAPVSSLRFLLSKMPRARAPIKVLDAHDLGATADHFTWMKHPQRVAAALVGEN